MDQVQVNSDYQNIVELRCYSCKEQIEDDIINFSGYPYHEKCVKCMICHQTYTSDSINYLVDIAPGIFLCSLHYDDYCTKKLSEDISNEITKKCMQASVKEKFEIPEIYSNSFVQNDSYDIFLPTSSFQFDSQTFSIDKVYEYIKDDAIIIDYDQDSLLLKLAFIDFFSDKIGEDANKSFQKVKEKFSSALGRSIVGNLINEPKLTIPNVQQINELLNRPSMNILQNNEALNKAELNELVKLVVDRAPKNDNLQYIVFFA